MKRQASGENVRPSDEQTMPDAASVYIKAAGGRKQPIRGALIKGSLAQSHCRKVPAFAEFSDKIRP